MQSGGDGIISAEVRLVGKLEGSGMGGSLEMMCTFTSLSKHFIVMGVSAMGQ